MTAVEELTSAEAGFAYALSTCGGAALQGYEVDELAAGPLRDFLKQAAGDSDEEGGDFVDAAARSWWRRGGDGAPKQARAFLAAVMSWSEVEREISELEQFLIRRRLRVVFDAAGGDLSPLSGEGFDLRRWLFGSQGLPLAGRLVILGGSLVGTIDAISMRRRLASVVKSLPAVIQAKIRQGLEEIYPLDGAVDRRVYEVYSRLAREKNFPDEELALLGLFFLINAAIFRQSQAMQTLKEALPRRLAHRVDPFCRACVQSRKPEVGRLIAPVVEAVGRSLTPTEMLS